MSEILSQNKTPLLDRLKICINSENAPFFAPGHKKGQGISSALIDQFGVEVFRADLPELPELDNLFAPEGVLEASQILAAQAFGAEKTWFLVNGSTCGIIAAILATCQPGDEIILPRNVHQSVISGLILSGAIPIFIQPEYDPDWDIVNSITPEQIRETLITHPHTKAVMMVYPTYHGVCGNLKEIVKIVHQFNLPLLVDEAHGAHFHFHPNLPTSALAAGADLSVQSTHKVLGAMTQASMLHLQGNRISTHRLNQALQFVESSSPSYLLLASLDAARQQMALIGEKLMIKTIELSQKARNLLSKIEPIQVLEKKQTPGFYDLDITRLTIKVSPLGLDGFTLDEILHQQQGVTAELPLFHHLTFIISLGNTDRDIEKLVSAFQHLSRKQKSPKFFQKIPNFSHEFPQSFLSPRQAFFAPRISVLASDAIGKISGELICPYPPGIPILMPGEEITAQAVNYLQEILGLGGKITGCSDPTLKKLAIIPE